MTDTRARGLVSEAVGAATAAWVQGQQVLVEAVGWVGTLTYAEGLQVVAEAVGADLALTVDAPQFLIEAIGWVGVPASPSPAKPMVFLVWSDDRGKSFSNPIGIAVPGVGQYLTSLQWQRLGMARDRIFEIEWSSPWNTVLQGAWLTTDTAHS